LLDLRPANRPRRAGLLRSRQAYDPCVRRTIDDVRAQALRLFRTEQGASAFLHAPCSALDGVPLELAMSGRAAEVLFYLERLESFAPARPPIDWVPGYRRST
jgi:hypothetical protein